MAPRSTRARRWSWRPERLKRPVAPSSTQSARASTPRRQKSGSVPRVEGWDPGQSDGLSAERHVLWPGSSPVNVAPLAPLVGLGLGSADVAHTPTAPTVLQTLGIATSAALVGIVIGNLVTH